MVVLYEQLKESFLVLLSSCWPSADNIHGIMKENKSSPTLLTLLVGANVALGACGRHHLSLGINVKALKILPFYTVKDLFFFPTFDQQLLLACVAAQYKFN